MNIYHFLIYVVISRIIITLTLLFYKYDNVLIIILIDNTYPILIIGIFSLIDLLHFKIYQEKYKTYDLLVHSHLMSVCLTTMLIIYIIIEDKLMFLTNSIPNLGINILICWISWVWSSNYHYFEFVVKNESSAQKIDICSICLEQFGDGEVCELECGHNYHVVCINDSILINTKCPYCRAEIRTKNDNTYICL